MSDIQDPIYEAIKFLREIRQVGNSELTSCEQFEAIEKLPKDASAEDIRVARESVPGVGDHAFRLAESLEPFHNLKNEALMGMMTMLNLLLAEAKGSHGHDLCALASAHRKMCYSILYALEDK